MAAQTPRESFHFYIFNSISMLFNANIIRISSAIGLCSSSFCLDEVPLLYTESD